MRCDFERKTMNRMDVQCKGDIGCRSDVCGTTKNGCM